MTKWHPDVHQIMFLIFITILTFDMTICQSPTTPTCRSLVFKNIGIKLCQLKCIENGFCRSIEYSISTLTCHLSEMDHDTITNEAQYYAGSKDLADVRDGSCQLRTCPNMRCLETRAGTIGCVKEKWNHTECNTILLDASIFGDLDRVKNILSDGRADINSMGKDNMTPVMYAAKEGHREVFDLLVRKGANLSFLDFVDMNILHLACIGGNVEIVKLILAQNIVDINSRDEDGVTPVMKAALYNRKDVFDLLVEEGANLLLLNNFKETILHVACEGGNVKILKYLMKHDIVDIDNRDRIGLTPVMHAARAGQKDVFDVLVEARADLSQMSSKRETILHLACEGGTVASIKYVLKHDIVDIDMRDIIGWTPLMHAASDGRKDVFDVLVEAGADLLLVTNDKETILHMACGGGNIEIVKYLLKHAIVDIDSRDINGWTPVMQAASEGYKDVLDVLVEEGADLLLVTNDKETILHVSCERKNDEMIKYLITNDNIDIDSRDADGWTPVMHAASAGHNDVFDVFVKAGGDLAQVSNDKKTVLHLACGAGNIVIIKYLLKHDIVDIDSRDELGLTPVMHAAIQNRKDAFNLLVEGGADLSILDENNNNILQLACSHDSVEVVKQLLTHKLVEINSKDGYDCTPAMIAARKGHDAVFFVLVDHGADLTVTNYVGDNILNLACEGENEHIVKYVYTRHIVEGPYRESDPC